MSHKENKVFKKDAELVVEFTFAKDSTMLEMERQIDALIDSIDDAVSESDKLSIKTQLLNAIKTESQGV
jgi:hypothetical protein